jgi:sugar phosphate isomerase/epimerase
MSASPNGDLSRLSLNQKTVDQWDMRQAIDGCVRHGIPWVALWRDKIEDIGLDETARLVRESGLRVSSLCRGGFFPAPTPEARAAAIEDNRRAIHEAATVGTDVLVMVNGGMAGNRIQDARAMVRDGIEAILPYAEERGVKIGIEPLHPAFAADRAVTASLEEASDLAEHFNSPWVGVVIDIYHVWWDAHVHREIKRARPYTLGFHVNDWLVPNTNVLVDRGMMGDGVVNNRELREWVDAEGYTGPIEVEIFNEEIWSRDGDDVLAQMMERYVQHVL